MRKSVLTGIAAAIVMFVPGVAVAQSGDLVQGVVGQDVLETSDLEDMIVKLEAESRKSKNDPALLLNLGQAYARLGDYDKAQLTFLRARDSRKGYDVLMADGAIKSTRRAAIDALKWLDKQPSQEVKTASY